MILEKQVANLELSRRLKELGVNQNPYSSYFTWYLYPDNETYLARNMPGKKRTTNDNCAAYSVAELGEFLPKAQLQFESFSKGHRVFHRGTGHVELEATEADARALMLIYLIENNLMTV